MAGPGLTLLSSFLLLFSGWMTVSFALPMSPAVTVGRLDQRPMVTAVAESEESDESYEDEKALDHPFSCGTDGFSMLVAEGTIDKDCPEIKNEMNTCCWHHDKCYDDQGGRQLCDTTFCNCLLEASKQHKLCHDEDAPVFCNLVRELGAYAYAAAGNATMNGTSKTSAEDTQAFIQVVQTTPVRNLTSAEYYSN